MTPLFHLAFPVSDLASTKKFYTETLGCDIGRSSDQWIDFNFFGNQLSAHVSSNIPRALHISNDNHIIWQFVV